MPALKHLPFHCFCLPTSFSTTDAVINAIHCQDMEWWNNLYCDLLKHQRHVFIQSHMFPRSHVLLTLFRMHSALLWSLSSPISSFLSESVSFSHVHTLRCQHNIMFFYVALGIFPESMCLRSSSIIHLPLTSPNTSKCVFPLHSEMTGSASGFILAI